MKIFVYECSHGKLHAEQVFDTPTHVECATLLQYSQERSVKLGQVACTMAQLTIL